MSETIKAANLGLAFVLELCILAALCYWGFHTGQTTLARLGLGLGAPLLAAVIWGLFLAPKATVAVPEPYHTLFELVVFGVAVASLFAAGRPVLGWIMGVAVVINQALLAVWKQ